MSKRKVIRKSNKPLNIYADGTWMSKSTEAWNNAGGENLAGSVGAIAGGATGILGGAMSNAQIADTSGVQSNINAAQDVIYQGSSASDLLNQFNAVSNIETVDSKDLTASAGTQIKNTLGGVASGAAAGATVGGPIGAVIGGAAGLLSGIAGTITGGIKAKREAERLNKEAKVAKAQASANFSNAVSNLNSERAIEEASSFYSYGGQFNSFKDGGIHIKPSKRGTFTAAAKKHGKSVQAFASQVLANKEDYSPAMVKKANFARNAASWHHAFGGNLNSNGADWDNGVIIVGNGGTHEENPNEGVQMGIDPQGIPNLVEEGEVVFNDYVFSNRLYAEFFLYL